MPTRQQTALAKALQDFDRQTTPGLIKQRQPRNESIRRQTAALMAPGKISNVPEGISSATRSILGAILQKGEEEKKMTRRDAFRTDMGKAVQAATPWTNPDMPANADTVKALLAESPLPDGARQMEPSEIAAGTGGRTGFEASVQSSGNPDLMDLVSRQRLAQILAPKPEETYGAPVAGQDAAGNPTYMRFGNRGGSQGVEGFVPPTKAPPVEKLPTGMRRNPETGGVERVPGYVDMQKEIRSAGKSDTNVNITTGKKDPLYDVDKAAFEDARKAVFEGKNLMPAYHQVVSALESGVETGRIKNIMRPLRQVLHEAGVAIDDSLPAEEQLAAAMNYIIPRMRVVGSGATSDFEARLFRGAAPNFTNTKEGNLLIGRAALQVQARREQEYDLMRKFYREKGNLDGLGQHIDEQLGSLFPKPDTPEAYDAIPAGTVYIHPDRGFSIKR